MTTHLKINGVWEEIQQPYMKINGNWTPAEELYTKIAGVWKEVWPNIKVITISEPTLNLNIADAFKAALQVTTLPVGKYHLINNSIIGGDKSLPTSFALNTGTFPTGSELTITNNGTIVGYGGDGAQWNRPGQHGGGAIRLDYPTTILNYGNIGGGGGGGGSQRDLANSNNPGVGGGGGAGYQPGIGGWGLNNDGGHAPTYDGDDGQTLTGGGSWYSGTTPRTDGNGGDINCSGYIETQGIGGGGYVFNAPGGPGIAISCPENNPYPSYVLSGSVGVPITGTYSTGTLEYNLNKNLTAANSGNLMVYKVESTINISIPTKIYLCQLLADGGYYTYSWLNIDGTIDAIFNSTAADRPVLLAFTSTSNYLKLYTITENPYTGIDGGWYDRYLRITHHSAGGLISNVTVRIKMFLYGYFVDAGSAG